MQQYPSAVCPCRQPHRHLRKFDHSAGAGRVWFLSFL